MFGELIEAGAELLATALELDFSWGADDEPPADPPVVLSREDETRAQALAARRGIPAEAARDLVAWARTHESP